MFKRSVKACQKTRLAALAGASLLLLSLVNTAEARHHHRHHSPKRFSQHHFLQRPAQPVRYGGREPGEFSARAAAIVVDGNSGRVLYGQNENALRHPASITKVMTLYLLFEQLEKGRLRLDSEIPISRHAAAQPPTKLGLHPGATIKVEDAIKAIVTRSANDMAVAVAEYIGGDEDTFAEMMTRKAHALGMTRTHYANASGLPNDEQITTAHDLSVLGRAIQDRFPRYYRYFSTRVFYYAGTVSPNHNHLMDRIEGMDGIKTGYTNASGFNLLTSVKRDGHYLVAVVMGGTSAASRDRTMARLIETQIEDGSTVRTAAAITDTSGGTERVAFQDRRVEDWDANESDRQKAEVPPAPSPQPIALKAAVLKPEPKADPKADPKPEPVLAPMQGPVRVASISTDLPTERPRPAVVSGAPKPAPVEDRPRGAKPVSLDGSTTTSLLATSSIRPASATPSSMRWVVGAQPAGKAEAQKVAKLEPSAKEPVSRGKEKESAKESAKEAAKEKEKEAAAESHNGWMIQIGATDDVGKANELLARAKSQGHRALSSAKPFTEKVQKGSGTLYRARFAGLEEDSAATACKALKRSGFSCFATKN